MTEAWIDAAGVRRDCASNEWYGHAAVLRRYCGVADGRPLRGRLQHGWSATASGLARTNDAIARKGPVWVWGRRGIWTAAEAGGTATAIGSPWLYLPPWEGSQPRSSRLAIPFHSIRKARVQDWPGYLASLLSRLPSAVLLHYEDEGAAALFRAAGIRVVETAGRPDGGFLLRLRAILRRYAEVETNTVQTAAFYAAYEGCRVDLRGPPTRTDKPDAAESLSWDPTWIAASFPAGVTQAVAEEELGREFVRSPTDLRRLLWPEVG